MIHKKEDKKQTNISTVPEVSIFILNNDAGDLLEVSTNSQGYLTSPPKC